MSARERIPRGSVSGPTHRSAPTVLPGIPSTPGGAGGDRAPPLPSYQGAKQRADVGIGPYRTKGRPHRPPWPAAQGGASAARMGGMGGDRGRGHPQSIQQPRTIPLSRRSRDSSLYTREPCPAGNGRACGHIGPPLRGHRNSQQRQTGRDRARPLQKDGEYAEGWGDERTQGRFDIYQAVIGLVSHKAQCPE